MSPSGPRGDGLQNYSALILDLLEKAVGLLSAMKSSQDMRQREDKNQDDRLVKMNKGLGALHNMLKELQKEVAELRVENRTVAETASTTSKKTTKQAEEDRVRSVSPRSQPSCVLICSRHLIYETIIQALPQVVNQAIARTGHHYPSHS
jgi:regulator of replication initiation timing